METKIETKVCKECGRELPIGFFKTSRWGTRASVCTPCACTKAKATREAKKTENDRVGELEQELARVKTMRLQDYSPRDLMNELARRGYKGELTFVQKIDITSF